MNSTTMPPPATSSSVSQTQGTGNVGMGIMWIVIIVGGFFGLLLLMACLLCLLNKGDKRLGKWGKKEDTPRDTDSTVEEHELVVMNPNPFADPLDSDGS